jgi:hypothetical protein
VEAAEPGPAEGWPAEPEAANRADGTGVDGSTGGGGSGWGSGAQIGGGAHVGYPFVSGGLVPFGGAARKASRTASGSIRTGGSGSEVVVEETGSGRPVMPDGSSPSNE